MIEEPRLEQTQAHDPAVIQLTIPREKIRDVMGSGLAELRTAVAAQGIAATGPWFTHHLSMQPDTFDFEIGVPVSKPVSPAGRVRPSQMPAMKVARTILHGDYEGLASGWGEFDAWIAAHGHKPGPDLWEVYLVGPETEPNASKWRTELSRPLTG
jgi:effector-binding domain-containing protein